MVGLRIFACNGTAVCGGWCGQLSSIQLLQRAAAGCLQACVARNMELMERHHDGAATAPVGACVSSSGKPLKNNSIQVHV
eukprot:58877-Chlamydomonas_euryale.AAC.5